MRNDGKNLYLLFVFNDVLSLTTLEYTGMKVFFNTEGKKSKDLGILFTRKAMPTETVIAQFEKMGQALTEEQKAELRKQPNQIVFVEESIDKKKEPSPSDPAVKTDAPAYRAASKAAGKQRVMYCEFRIPLSRVNEPRGIGTEPGQSIKLGFEWGGVTNEIMKIIMADRAAGGVTARQGASAMSVSDSSGDGSGAGADFAAFNRDPRFKKHSFWIDLKLAAQ